jgi:hypothetical protein
VLCAGGGGGGAANGDNKIRKFDDAVTVFVYCNSATQCCPEHAHARAHTHTYTHTHTKHTHRLLASWLDTSEELACM